jgi:hypothetical protein
MIVEDDELTALAQVLRSAGFLFEDVDVVPTATHAIKQLDRERDRAYEAGYDDGLEDGRPEYTY